MSDIALPGANAILDGTPLPATLYVQAHLGNPGANGTSNLATETDRQPFTRTAASGGTCTNASEIQWLNWPATEDVSHLSIWDASSGGTCWFIDDIADEGIQTGDSVTIIVGALAMSLNVWS